ncbi:MAG: YbaY family lipoprotein [Pseudomonas sp.]|uniref:YbaY family lipoprotein n=1 Tax=Pseudomonas sp. TaxID=306 RepID=UPI0027177C04|nr:YbaY family lipoprotein [Pseudomonas sp.]
MSLRPLAPLCLFALLGACSSAPPATAPAPAPRSAVTAVPLAALPAELRELSGQLLGVPLAGEAEVALLLVDQRDRPLQLLASTRLNGTGAALPFSLRFAPNQLAPGMRAELRARVSQGGVLTLHLPPRQIDPSVSLALGELRLVPAP